MHYVNPALQQAGATWLLKDDLEASTAGWEGTDHTSLCHAFWPPTLGALGSTLVTRLRMIPHLQVSQQSPRQLPVQFPAEPYLLPDTATFKAATNLLRFGACAPPVTGFDPGGSPEAKANSIIQILGYCQRSSSANTAATQGLWQARARAEPPVQAAPLPHAKTYHPDAFKSKDRSAKKQRVSLPGCC